MELDISDVFFPVFEPATYAGHGEVQHGGVAPAASLTGYRPLDDRLRSMNKLGETAAERADAALEQERQRLIAADQEEQVLRGAALAGKPAPRGASKQPDLEAARDRLAIEANAFRDKQIDEYQRLDSELNDPESPLVTGWLGSVEKQDAAVDAELLKTWDAFKAATEKRAMVNARIGFATRATTHQAPWISKLKEIVPSLPSGQPEAIASLERSMFNPHGDGNQGVPWRWNPGGDVAPPTDPRQMAEAVT